jgi:TRAP-type C4-dicarboxylate transport system permease small subunit
MKKTIQRLAKFFSTFFASGASISMFLLFLIIFINSVRRYAFGKSLEWGEELPVYVAIYGVMFGIAWAYMQDRHIRFTMLVGFIAKQQERWLMMLVDILMVVTGSALTYSGYLFVIKRGGMESSGLINLAKQLRDGTGWDFMIWLGHFYPYQSAIMIGGTMLTLAALLKFCLRLADDASAMSS